MKRQSNAGGGRILLGDNRRGGAITLQQIKFRGRCVSSRGWKHIYLGIYTETGDCDCRLKELLMMGIIMPETFQRLCE
jgi:hypothetical protein